MIRAGGIAAAVVMLLLTLFLFPPITSTGDLGLCLPSPNQWELPRFAGWLLNAVFIFLSAAVMAATNKRFNFLQEADPIMSLSLLILLAAGCVSSATLSTSTILLLANTAGLYLLLSTYEERNAAREFFMLATIPAFGAMVQYAFLLLVPLHIFGGLMMKSFRIREFIAYVLGLLAPYWIVVGLGVIPPEAFRLPDTLTVISTAEVQNDLFLTLLATGLMALIGIVLAFYNGVRLFTRNSRLRGMHMTFNAMGILAVAAVIFDFTNFVAYFGLLALWVAIETATMLWLYNARNPGWAVGILLLLFLPFFILEI